MFLVRSVGNRISFPATLIANALTSIVTILLTPTRNFSNSSACLRAAYPASHRHSQSQAAVVNQGMPSPARIISRRVITSHRAGVTRIRVPSSASVRIMIAPSLAISTSRIRACPCRYRASPVTRPSARVSRTSA